MVDRFKTFSSSIFEITRCWHKLAGEEMAKYDLKGPYAIYLIALDQHEDGLTARQICELCGRDKADVSRAMTDLEQRSLICRTGEGAYRTRLQLTKEGKIAARHVGIRAGVAVEKAGEGLSEQDRSTFYRALGIITDNMHRLSQEGLPE
jgi:DNA-binding MarR family transcriptional regulator